MYKILVQGWVAMVFVLGMGLATAACDTSSESDPYQLCCGCMSANHCLQDTPEDVSAIVNWCRGELEEGGEVDYDEGCMTDLCTDECDILQ